MQCLEVSVLDGRTQGAVKVKVKLKASLCTPLRRIGEKNYNATHSYPQHQMKARDQLDASATLPLQNERGAHCLERWWVPHLTRTFRTRQEFLTPCRHPKSCSTSLWSCHYTY